MAHWYNREPDLARADFDQALKLKPDDADGAHRRGAVSAQPPHEPAEVLAADLDAADRAMPKDADERWQLGQTVRERRTVRCRVLAVLRNGSTRTRAKVRHGDRLNSRCWARARWGQELDEALADCNAALKLRPGTAAILDSRGLVYLRKGDFKSAIADYDAALRTQQIPGRCTGAASPRLRTGRHARGRRTSPRPPRWTRTSPPTLPSTASLPDRTATLATRDRPARLRAAARRPAPGIP